MEVLLRFPKIRPSQGVLIKQCEFSRQSTSPETTEKRHIIRKKEKTHKIHFNQLLVDVLNCSFNYNLDLITTEHLQEDQYVVLLRMQYVAMKNMLFFYIDLKTGYLSQTFCFHVEYYHCNFEQTFICLFQDFTKLEGVMMYYCRDT